MLSIIRNGPESLVLHATDKISEIKALLDSWGTKIELTAEEALGVYGANRRLVFFGSSPNLMTEEDTIVTYVSENTLEFLLSDLINERLVSGVESVKILPGFLMMRLLGDIEKGINRIQADIGGEIIDRDPMYRNYIPSTSTIIYFTKMSLNRSVPTKGMYKKALLIHHRSRGAITQFLTVRGIEYLGDALGTPDWNDIEIKIYDANGFFDMHRSRLWVVIQGLQVGMALGEQWGKDQATTFKSVPVYVVRLFTPLDPQEIKRLCMGLEYDDAGRRFADFDVFHKDRKISAYTEFEARPGLSRNDIGLIFRNDIIRHLDYDSRNELLRIEEKLNEKRKDLRSPGS